MKCQNKTIGKWTCPSGNRVDASFQGNGPDVAFIWDVGPPIPEADLGYYLKVIRPQAVMKALVLTQKRHEQEKGNLP